MKDMLENARRHRYAVGYFEAFNMDAMLAVLDAAEKTDSPVIIGFGGQFISSPEREVKEDVYHYGALALQAAQRSKVPTAVLLNEADEEPMIYEGMKSGFNAVMYQKQGEEFETTVKITKEICRVAHFLDIDVESEVGELPTADIVTHTMSAGSNTDVKTAKYFVEETGIDALAVAVGNVHLLEGEKSLLDYELLEKLSNEIAVPLVLHGGTGVSEEDIKKAISMGISKVNVGTVLKREYINAVKEFCKENDLDHTDPHVIIGWGGQKDIISRGRSAISNKVEDFMCMFGSNGKADLLRRIQNG